MGAREPGTFSVECVVLALVSEFHQAHVRDADGRLYAITSRTRGIEWASLREGQRLVGPFRVNAELKKAFSR